MGMGNSKDIAWRRFRLWSAHYDWNPDIDFGDNPYGPWTLAEVIGEQYQGSTNVAGGTIDLNTFKDSWMAPAPAPSPTPEPSPPEEVIMGEILDLFTAAGKKLEAEIARAKKLPAAIPGPPGPAGPAGKDATGGTTAPAPAPTGETYTVVPGDSLGAVALKYKSGWPAGMTLWGKDGAAAKLASYNGIDVNGTLHEGQVLRIPW